MKSVRYRSIDLLWLCSLVCLVLSAGLVGIQPRLPQYLAGNFDAYYASNALELQEKIWHKSPDGRREHAILQLGQAPNAIDWRINWPTLAYDALVTVLAGAVLLFGVQRIRRARSLHNIPDAAITVDRLEVIEHRGVERMAAEG